MHQLYRKSWGSLSTVLGPLWWLRRQRNVDFSDLLSRTSSSFITTPIFYVNSSPHVGHLYTALLGDAVHRWRTLKNPDDMSIYSTGTDEHGMKVQKAACAAGKEAKEFCGVISDQFKSLFDKAKISYTHYVRTTDEQHEDAVASLWSTLKEKGYIYKGKYEGWYCVADEQYLADADVVKDTSTGEMVSCHSNRPVEWYREDNYMFRLSQFQEKLLAWLNTAPYPVVPMFAKDRVTKWLEDDRLKDLSVSRPSSRLSWGVPVPGDPSQTVYVWLDALVNYLTVSGYPSLDHLWPPTEHIIGQDILRFHAIYWPAFLMAAGLELPRKIVTHSHWTCSGHKMSKSIGNVVDPRQQFHWFGRESVRYFMLKRASLQRDQEYSMESLVTEVNSDLADGIGNLLSRVCSKKLVTDPASPGLVYSSQLFSLHGDDRTPGSLETSEDREFIQELHKLPEIVDEYYQDFNIRKATEAISNCLKMNNKFLGRWQPWHLRKDPANLPAMESVLLITMENVRLCASLLWPIIPRHAGTALVRLGFPRVPLPHQLTCLLTKDKVTELEVASVFMRQHNDSAKPLFNKLSVPWVDTP